jgi:chromate transporter
MLLVSIFLKRFAEYTIVQNALAGIRLAVCALILDATIKLLKGFWKNGRAIIVCVIAFILSAVFSASPVFIILGAALAGFLFFTPRGKKGNE